MVKRYKIEQDIGPHHTEKVPDCAKIPNAVPKHEPKSKIGNPASYTVFNKTYVVLPTSKGYKAKGTASWYGKKFHGYHTSSGEVYDMYGMSAAHKTLPLPTYAKVTNLQNGKHVIVKINDRGPFHEDRIIDLSYAAAAKLGVLATGTAKVEIRALDPSDKTPQLFVQIGSFDAEQNAKKLANKIESLTKDKKHNIAIKHSKTKNGKKYHVHIGPLNDETVMTELTNTLINNKLPKPKKIHR
ncbi:MAG TPA: septal ring lytic transglycosylase RlpA family protein [Gammaproteobacteria bacterium]|nr:septal ring lytic transglycosylase RlpA family protein [Gammaproteobacteria bacterium]